MLFSVQHIIAQSLTASSTTSNYNGYAVSCTGSEDGSINLSVSGGTAPYSFVWNTANGSATADGTTTEDLANLKAGTYTVMVTDSVGAADTLAIVLNQPSSLSASLFSQSFNGYNIHCQGGADGQITTTVNGGVAPFQYLWSTGDTVPNIGGLAADSYQLIVTGANGCKDTSTIVLLEPLGLALQLNPSITPSGYGLHCAGGNSGTIDLAVTGGVGNYIYNWSHGAITQDLTGLTADVYSVRVEDGNGCVKIDSTTLTEPLPLSVTGNATEYAAGEYFSCDTCNDGSYSLTVSGGSGPVAAYTYQWSSGQTTSAVSSLSPNTYYTFTVTDNEACTVTDSILLPANVQTSQLELFGTLSSYAGGHQVSTFGGSNGWIDLQVIGGNPPYNYQWAGPPTLPAALAVFQDLNEMSAGTYTVVVTDADQQQAEKTFTLNGPANPLSATLSVLSPNCPNVNSGQLAASVSGATPPSMARLRQMGQQRPLLPN